MLIIGPMFEFSDFGIWTSDLFVSMDFEFYVFGLKIFNLDLRFAKIDVGYCP